MQYSLEAFFLVNFAVDAALLTIVARANDCLRLRRILLSGLLSASYALLTETVSARLAHPAIQFLLLVILSMILCGDSTVRRWCSIAIQLTGGTMILGGVGTLFPSSAQIPATITGAGLILTAGILSIRNQKILSWEVTVLISLKGRCISFQALIDTGNRLHEPISGLPVLIAEAALLNQLPLSNLPFRQIRYGGLGGYGSVKCFRPDAVLIRRGDRYLRAPEVWIAAYPGRIPGSTHALAPPSFAVIPGNA